MPETLAQHGAIEAARSRPRGIRLAERADVGKIDLRGDPADRAFMAAIGRCLDMVLPTEPNTSTSQGQVTALWLGPDEWLLICPASETGSLMGSLSAALHAVHAALTEVTDGQVTIRLSGPNARDVLAKGCPLDLHRRTFSTGSAARSTLAQASVLLHLVQDGPKRGPVFDLYVARSFARYLWAWLEDAGLEYGVQVDVPT